MFMQGRRRQSERNKKLKKRPQRIARVYMIRNNPSWGNMSPMQLVECQRGDIIAHDLCWHVVNKAWSNGKIFDEASYTWHFNEKIVYCNCILLLF